MDFTYLESIKFMLGAFSSGIALGVPLGIYFNSHKEKYVAKMRCKILIDHTIQELGIDADYTIKPVEVIYCGLFCRSCDCLYIDKKICTLTNKKCKYL